MLPGHCFWTHLGVRLFGSHAVSSPPPPPPLPPRPRRLTPSPHPRPPKTRTTRSCPRVPRHRHPKTFPTELNSVVGSLLRSLTHSKHMSQNPSRISSIFPDMCRKLNPTPVDKTPPRTPDARGRVRNNVIVEYVRSSAPFGRRARFAP